MKKIEVKIYAEEGAKIPEYKTLFSAGADLFPLIPIGNVTLLPGERKLFKTGLRMAIPNGYELQVRPRSGLALKFGITVVNTPGTIDSKIAS